MLITQDTAMLITEPRATRPPEHASYVLSRWLFLRLLGLVYLIAFVSLAVQIGGLVGEHGLLPAKPFLEQARAVYGNAAYRLFPTFAWLGAGDGALRLLCWAGALLSALLVGGVAELPVLALLWACYLSLSVVGQAFLWFQWDALLLETGLLAILYAPAPPRWLPSLERTREPSDAMRWLLWALVFKLMFLSGVTKLASGDPTWRGLTALDYHFWTQPLPPWTAWYAQRLPAWMRHGMTVGILVIELGAPWLILAPRRLRRLRLAGCALIVAGQLAIAVTGNYGFFNLLSIVLCVPLLDDAALERVLPLSLSAAAAQPGWQRLAIRVFVPVVATISALALVREIVATLPAGRQTMGRLDHPVLQAVAPFRSINGYGLFRVMTTERRELVIEGSRDGVRWTEYDFPAKPGTPARRPRFVAPHMPRLDWQMWFAALNPDGAAPWLTALLRRLLEGSPDVLALLDGNPFPDGPPRYVRLAYYRYRFSTAAERRQSGVWWERELMGYLTRALSLPERGAR